MLRHSWAIGVVVLYGLVLSITAATGSIERPVPSAPTANLLDKPLGEDGFYMLSVARSVARGHGLSYGAVETTGVQPLATVIYAGVYAISDAMSLSPEAPLRAVIFLNVLVLAVTALASMRLVALQLRDAGVGDIHTVWIVGSLVAVNTAAFRLYTYGLETGIYLLCLVLVQLSIQQRRRPLVIGALCGVCFLARVDFAIVAIVVVGIHFLRGRFTMRELVIMAATAGIVALPWVWYVFTITGGLMPSSGASQASVPANMNELAGRLWSMFSAIVIAGSAVLYLPIRDALLERAIVALLAATIGVSVWVMRREFAVAVRDQWPSLLGGCVVAAYYTMASYAVHFYPRYIAPLWLVWVQVLGGTIAVTVARRRVAPSALGALNLALIAVFATQIGYTLHRGTAGNTHLFTGYYIARHQPSLGVVGAFQSGVVGYMTDERTVNLDGKLDGRALAWRDALHLECYLAERGVSTLIDWESNIRNGWIDRAFVDNRMREIDRVDGGASLVMKVDATAIDCSPNP